MSTQAALPILSRRVKSVAPTPLQPVQLHAGQPTIWCKLEDLSPSGSTSIAMAMVCAQIRFKFMAVRPEGGSNSRVRMIRAYGGTVRLTPTVASMAGGIELTQTLARTEGAFLPKQPSNSTQQ